MQKSPIVLIFLCLSLFLHQNLSAQTPTLMGGSTTTNACSGILMDSGGFGNYDSNDNDTIDIITSAAFTSFIVDSLNITGNGSLKVYEISPQGIAYLKTTFTAVFNPYQSRNFIIYADYHLRIIFKADSSAPTNKGFVAYWACAPTAAQLSPCYAYLYDSGGPSGNYLPNQTTTNTYCPNIPNKRMNIYFSSIDVPVGDSLCIYDGDSTNAPLLAFIDNNTNGSIPNGNFRVQASNGNTNGCLTVVLKSNATITGGGYRADLGCVKACQKIVPELLMNATVPSVPTIAGDSAINICKVGSVTISARASYPQNNTIYAQNDTTSIYTFDWMDGTPNTVTTNHTATHIYDRQGLFFPKVTVSDPDNLCGGKTKEKLRVRLLKNLNYTIRPIPAICVGDTARLTTGVYWSDNIAYGYPSGLFGSGTVGCEIPFYDIKCIPDAIGVGSSWQSVLSTIAVGGIESDTVNSNTIKCIYVNFEHSYAGDLEIQLLCPNGRSVTLKSQTVNSGTNKYFGIADGSNTNCANEGTGLYYGWLGANTTPSDVANTPTSGALRYNCLAQNYYYTMGFNNTVSMNDAFAAGTTYTQVLCNPYVTTNPAVLSPGYYLPFQSLNTLNGCPINGNWTLKVTDKAALDNGTVFMWGIRFNPNLFPAAESYGAVLDTMAWVCTPTSIGAPCVLQQDTMYVSPTQAGDYTYRVHASIAGFSGCNIDTSIVLHVNPANISITTTPDTTNIGVGTASINTSCINTNNLLYRWSNNATTNTITGLLPGTYTVTVTTANGATYTASATVPLYIDVQSAYNTYIDFSVQPNPNNGNMLLKANFASPTESIITIQNNIGQVVFLQKNTTTNTLLLPLDLSQLPDGIYFATIRNANGIQTQKLVVAH
jgi:subtilisin-like proprotein convertase family protein